MKYLVHVTLSNGNEIRAKINGHDKEDAIKNLQFNTEFQSFLNSEENAMAHVTDMSADPLQPRYDFRITEGICRCTDTRFGFLLEWEIGRYKETAKASLLTESTKFHFEDTTGMSTEDVATEMKHMGDWIATFHHEEAFEPITINERIVGMLKNAMQYSGMTYSEISDATGIKLNRVVGYLEGSYRCEMTHLYSMIRAMGAELKIVFPDEQ